MGEIIRLDERERTLIADKEFFERKLAVSGKIKRAYAEMRDELRSRIKPERYLAPEGVDFTEGKLSGGEKHYDLPYLFLDFPRRFSREFIFAYRSIFWWGHHFLFTLILSGDRLPDYRERAFAGWASLAARGDWIAVTDDPFEWRNEDRFFERTRRDNADALAERTRPLPFLKLIHFIPFDDPRLAEGELTRLGVDTFLGWEFVITR